MIKRINPPSSMSKFSVIQSAFLFASISALIFCYFEREIRILAYAEITEKIESLKNIDIHRERLVEQIDSRKAEIHQLQLPYASDSAYAASAHMLIEVRNILKSVGMIIASSHIAEVKKVDMAGELRIEIKGSADLHSLRDAIFLIESFSYILRVERLAIRQNKMNEYDSFLEIEINIIGIFLDF